ASRANEAGTRAGGRALTPLLEGRVAFVTGGAQGIGLAIAERFAAQGSRVMIGDARADEAAAQAARLTAAGGDVKSIPLDVTDADSVEAAADACAEMLG